MAALRAKPNFMKSLRSFFARFRLDALLYLNNRVVARFPSHTVRLFFYRRIMKYQIGEQSHIFMDAWFDAKGRFSLGAHSSINRNCRLDNRGTLTIGDNVSISNDVSILTADHDPSSPTFSGRKTPVIIEDHVFIGTRAMILPGVTIGQGAIVAAGAIVTKSVEPFAIVAGVPARKIGERNRALNYQADYMRLFS